MSTKVYEGMFLLDSNRYARDPGGVSGQITQIVEKCGGEILASRLWNEQKLAYSIEGHRKGTYWLTYFRMECGKQGELTRACRLNDNILRNLVIRIDDRLVDTLVRHATDSGRAPAADAAAKEAAAKEAAAKEAAAKEAAAKEAAAKDAAPKEAEADTAPAADDPDQQAEQVKTDES